MKKVVSVITLMILLIVFSTNYVYASSLSLEVKADKDTAQIGDNITITVDWKEKMQAADYILKYDSSKLEYVSSSVEDTYINKTQVGQIGISWFSSNNTDLTQMTFTFKVIAKGAAEVSVQIDGGFSDGEMNIPESYDVNTKGKKTITLTEKNTQEPSGTENQDDKNKKTQENEINNNNTQNQINNNQENQNNSQNSNQNNNENKVQNNNTNQNNATTPKTNNATNVENTTAKTVLPKTGDRMLIVSIIGIILILIILVTYRMYKKYMEI